MYEISLMFIKQLRAVLDMFESNLKTQHEYEIKSGLKE